MNGTSVTALQYQNKPKAIKILVYVVLVVGMGLIVYFGGDVIKNLGNLRGKSALSITVLEGEAKVLLNNEEIGKTPLESQTIRSGENKVTVKGDAISYETSINFLPNTQVVINRDLGVSDVFSSGQDFWMEKSDGTAVLNVITEPSKASVYIDNTKVGETPYSSSTLIDGEYDLRLEAAGYESQSARIKIQADHKLSISVRLFPSPVPAKIALLEGADSLYDIYSANPAATANPATWVKAILYWNKIRGINLSGAGVNKDPVFDYFIDYEGTIYNKDGDPVSVQTLEETSRGAYLRKPDEGAGLSQAAKQAFEILGKAVSPGKKAKILDTGTGWLRVRDVAGLTGKEIAKVDVGKEYTVVEEGLEWVKIKVDDKTQGWVSSTYVKVTE